jgi:tRNA U34 5-carboxymethylaminomethyl modifying GTPase MnmE/TrmE
MPLIARPINALVGLGAVVVAGIGAARGSRAIKERLESGKTVAFIGRPATGKSTMLHVLASGDVPARAPAPTVDSEPVEVTVHGDFVVTVIDSGGDRLGQQHAAVTRSARVVYFFDASRVAAEDRDTLSALEADADHIERLFQKDRRSRRFSLVGTHADLLDPASLQAVKKHPAIQKLQQAARIGSDDVIIGSLATKKAAVDVSIRLATSQTRKA